MARPEQKHVQMVVSDRGRFIREKTRELSKWLRRVCFAFCVPAAVTFSLFAETPPGNLPTVSLKNVSVQEGQSATFSAKVEAAPPVSFRWFRNGKPISKSNRPSYTVRKAGFEHDVDLYSIVVSNRFGVARAEAVLSVLPVQPPVVSSVLNLGISNQVTVIFSEAIDSATASRVENYSIDDAPVLMARVLGRKTVLLEVKPMLEGKHRLHARNIRGLDARAPGPVSSSCEIEAGLKSWLRFEEFNSTDAVDSSGNRISVRLDNALMRTENGRMGAGLNFNGKSDHASFAIGMADFSEGLTFVLWVKPTAVKHFARFIEFGNGVLRDNIIFGRLANSQALFFETKVNEEGVKVVATKAIELDEWQHFAVSMDADGRVKLYKNGTLLKEGFTSPPTIATRSNNYLGRSNWPVEIDAFYEGQMDEVRVYERPLSSDEIKVLAGGKP